MKQISYRIIAVLMFLCVQSVFAQETQVTLGAGIDTVNNLSKQEVFHLWSNYLNSKPDSVYDNPFWNKEEKLEFSSFDLLNNAGFLSPSLYGLVKQGGKNTVLSITPVGEYYEIRSIFYFPYPDNSIYPLAIVKYMAKKENGKFRLSNYLPFYSRNWLQKTVGHFIYHYHPDHPFDQHKANDANDYYQRLSEVFDLKKDTINYYIAENCNGIFDLQGFDHVISKGSENNLCGFIDFPNNILYSNTIAGEDYRHEITHQILDKYPNSGIFHLGIVAYWGGENAHFSKPLSYHITRVNSYLKAHPEIDLSNFIEDFYELDEFTSPHYVLAAIFCHLAMEQGGVGKLKKLFSYGNEDGNSYNAIEKEFGIERKELNSFLRKKIDDFATRGIVPIMP